MAGAVLERVLAIVTEGSKLGTHKLALLLAILDACIEGASTDGAPPSRLRSVDLARRVLALHWRHTLPFALDGSTIALRQVSRSAKGPHAYLREVAALRKRAGADETTRIEEVIAVHPAAHAAAVARVGSQVAGAAGSSGRQTTPAPTRSTHWRTPRPSMSAAPP